MECIYDVTLINRDPQLDLRTESEKIAHIIHETLDLRPEVTRCEVVRLDTHSLMLSVEETGTFWHGVIGRKIANDPRLWCYRSPNDLSQMFRWRQRSSPADRDPIHEREGLTVQPAGGAAQVPHVREGQEHPPGEWRR